MCRLLAARFAEPQRIQPELRALRELAAEHKDGWGAAFYPKPNRAAPPSYESGTLPANQDATFRRLGSTLHARTALAHIRLASTGAVTLENAHPFTHGRWSFAHNGQLRDFDAKRLAVESMISPELRAQLRGQTDSERCFLVFLTRLRARVGDESKATPRDVAVALSETIQSLGKLTDAPGARSSMNFVVTNGDLVVAARRGKPLFVSADGVTGPLGRMPFQGERLKGLLVASEPGSSARRWHEVPNDSIVSVDRFLKFDAQPLSRLGAGG